MKHTYNKVIIIANVLIRVMLLSIKKWQQTIAQTTVSKEAATIGVL